MANLDGYTLTKCMKEAHVRKVWAVLASLI